MDPQKKAINSPKQRLMSFDIIYMFTLLQYMKIHAVKFVSLCGFVQDAEVVEVVHEPGIPALPPKAPPGCWERFKVRRNCCSSYLSQIFYNRLEIVYGYVFFYICYLLETYVSQ